jgi:hypothetical protein
VADTTTDSNPIPPVSAFSCCICLVQCFMPHELTSPRGDLTSKRWPDPVKVALPSGSCRLQVIMDVFICSLFSDSVTLAEERLMVG